MILAIDQSYSGTGVAYISKDGRIESGLIKTRSDMPWETRIDFILDSLNRFFDLSAITMTNPSPVQYVVLESYAYGTSNSMIFQLGELGGNIKYNFHKKGVDAVSMLIAYPKMYMARNGQADKAQVINGLMNRFGIRESNDNVADAISIGLTYRAWLRWKETKDIGNSYDNTLMIKVDTYLNGIRKDYKKQRTGRLIAEGTEDPCEGSSGEGYFGLAL